MRPNTWEQDIIDGQNAEKELANLLIGRYPKRWSIAIFNDSEDINILKGWDFRLIGKDNIRFEVKYDKMSESTGNFAIEYKSGGSASGLFATESQIFAIKSGSAFYLFDTRMLRDYISNRNFKKATVFHGKTEIFLVPMDKILTELENKKYDILSV